ncbi:hypothetical protein GC102_02140 [Paenibacillus sp. LMG 31460]|uniref:Uncharacterized protein n=1 Tax=Paenibacillus germinis TaxID=2654979 RepID=A0ABX1YXV7_9BACL|nr:hypothetical protein [Paenibacillus germinis]NOU84578.1 hypothetical protein [Paenibacillus germinis]
MDKTRGVSKIFSAQGINQLERNPNVLRVSETTITYSPAFKVAAVKANLTSQPPMEMRKGSLKKCEVNKQLAGGILVNDR